MYLFNRPHISVWPYPINHYISGHNSRPRRCYDTFLSPWLHYQLARHAYGITRWPICTCMPCVDAVPHCALQGFTRATHHPGSLIWAVNHYRYDNYLTVLPYHICNQPSNHVSNKEISSSRIYVCIYSIDHTSQCGLILLIIIYLDTTAGLVDAMTHSSAHGYTISSRGMHMASPADLYVPVCHA